MQGETLSRAFLKHLYDAQLHHSMAYYVIMQYALELNGSHSY